jgi:hypothetical protein
MAQLAEDHALAKMQLEEKDAEERLAKVRPSLFCGLARSVDVDCLGPREQVA